MRKFLYWSVLLAACFACAPSRVVRPLEKGDKVIGFNFGGPLIDFAGLTIPIPFTSFYGAYGLQEDLSLFGGVHATSMAYGVFQVDLGVTKGITESAGWKPGFSVSPAVHLFADRWEWNAKMYPELGLNAYWEYGEKTSKLFYLGMINWFELERSRAYGQEQRQWLIPNFQAGHTFQRPRMNYTVEVKYFNPFASNRDIVVNYRSFGETGAVGIMFSVARKF